MGCVTSVEVNQDHATQQNLQLDRIVKERRNMRKSRVKLLLLGAGESGKSTVLKQLRLLHKGGFTEDERRQYRDVLWADCVGSMQTLIIQARMLDIPLDCDRLSSPLYQYKQKILGYKPFQGDSFGNGVFKDFILKYSETSAARRRQHSTGKAFSAWDDDNDVATNSDDSDRVMSDELGRVAEENSTYSKQEIGEAISQLWENDRGIGSCFAKSNQFQLEDSAKYLFENAQRYALDGYECTNEDILRGRIKTTGITETDFNINGMRFKILDAGGQRSERKKWMHCFQDITCTCFVLAVSEYDQVLFEDERVNRMHEAIMLFESLCNSRWFRDTPFILFLNKTDLLQEKVRRSLVRKYFPDYNGKSNDPDAVLEYFEKLFLSLNRTNKPIYVHRTCATDTKSMKFVLSAVTDMLIQQNLKNSGIF